MTGGKLTNHQVVGLALAAAAGLVLWLVLRRGIGKVAAGAAEAAVQAAEGIAVGTVGAIGEVVGLPAPNQTTTDPAVARWLIDNFGHFEASKWASAMALLRGEWMDAGTGTPPPPGSPVALAHPMPAARADSPAVVSYEMGIQSDDPLPGDGAPNFGFPM